MTIVTVQEISQTKSGTPKVKANNVWYYMDRDAGSPPSVGMSVEVRVGSFTAGDPPKSFPTIQAWRVPPQNGSLAPQPHKPVVVPESAPVDEASLRYISNVVGQAIAAKTITEPGQ